MPQNICPGYSISWIYPAARWQIQPRSANFRSFINYLCKLFQPIDPNEETFWDQFWSENVSNVQDIFTLVPAAEIRQLREDAPANLATLCYKAVEKLVKAVDNSCRTHREQQTGNKRFLFLCQVMLMGLCSSELH